MKTTTEILVLPYDSTAGVSLLQRLIVELAGGNWNRFRAAVAFGKSTAANEELMETLVEFCKAGGTVELTFGADVFGSDTKGSDFELIKSMLGCFAGHPAARLFLYHEKGRTFHPKIYLFDNEKNKQALAIIGSSNWSHGGLVNNVEANVVIHFDLADGDNQKGYARLSSFFDKYWRE